MHIGFGHVSQPLITRNLRPDNNDCVGTDGDLRSSGVPCAAENSSNIPVAPGMKSVQNLGSARHCQNCQIPSPQQIELVLSTAVSAATRAAMQTVILSAEHVQKYVSSVAEAKVLSSPGASLGSLLPVALCWEVLCKGMSLVPCCTGDVYNLKTPLNGFPDM